MNLFDYILKLFGGDPTPPPTVIVKNQLMGIATYQEYNSNNNIEDFPEASQMYFRSYWDEIEPEEGQVNIDAIRSILSSADAQGQKVGFRIMADANKGMRIPQWLKNKIDGTVYIGSDGEEAFMPNHDHPEYLNAVDRLLNALGTAFDGDPRLNYIDIGFVGHWGEWHTSKSETPLPTRESWKRIINAHFYAFPNTKKIMLIGAVNDNGEPLRYAVDRGAGWRADCLGDFIWRPAGWSHMDVFYPEQIELAGVQDAWKVAPVMFETCGHPLEWKELHDATPRQVELVLDWALENHVSLVNFREKPIPAEYRDAVDTFLTKCGHQLSAKNHEITSSELICKWTNNGVAPPYMGINVQYKVSTVDNQVLHTSPTIARPREEWLPGDISFTLALDNPLPAGLVVYGRILNDRGEIINLVDDTDSEGWTFVTRT